MTRTAGRTGHDVTIGFSFKMYFGYRQTLDWCARARELAAASAAVADGRVRLFVMPSFPCLAQVIEMFRGTPIEVGAQNLYFEDRGPFTGEVSAEMLAEMGCTLVEIGHSERRRLFGESDQLVGFKVHAALRNGLRPVICVGEEESRGAAYASRESTRQLEVALNATQDAPTAGVVVAYEPLWAIGADEPASDTHIVEACQSVREFMESTRPQADDRVIYGGSAGPGLLERLGDGVDGLFLGRFAHNPDALEKVLREAGRVGTQAT